MTPTPQRQESSVLTVHKIDAGVGLRLVSEGHRVLVGLNSSEGLVLADQITAACERRAAS